MDKNTLLGMLLMGLVLFGFMYCNRPNNETSQDNAVTETTVEQQREQAAADALNADFSNRLGAVVRDYGVSAGDGKFKLNTEKANLTATADTAGNYKVDGVVRIGQREYNLENAFDPADTTLTITQRAAISDELNGLMAERRKFGAFGRLLDEKAAEPVTVTNGKMTVTFNPKGGRMERVALIGYKNENTDPVKDVELLSPGHGSYEFLLNCGDREISTAELVFTPEVSADSSSVTMTLAVTPDTWMKFVYTLVPDEFVVRLAVTQNNMDAVIPANVTRMGFVWHTDLERNEVGRSFEERNSAIYYKMKDSSPDDLSANKADSETVNGAVQWVAFKNQFFSSVVIPAGYFATAQMESQPIDRDTAFGNRFVKTMDLKSVFDYSSTKKDAFAFDFYLGPNSYPGLSHIDDVLLVDGQSSDLELNKLVPLGWGIFGWINRFIVIPLFNLLGSFITSYGLIILLLTIIIKIILFPFTYKSYMSQAKMRVLAPEIKEINEKYPGQENAMKRQQETMKLYSKAGASPFSGCLPMLLQLPVLIALFSFFPSAIELRGQSFLWAHDLAAPDYICTLPFSIPFYGDKVSLFCLLMTVTNIIYTRISMASNPSAGMAGMKWMTYLMPVMFLFFFNDYASGLSYYYFISLLITIGQTYFCRRIVDEGKVRAQMMENAKKPKKKTGFMARLEAAQKKQEAMMREQAKQRAKRGR